MSLQLPWYIYETSNSYLIKGQEPYTNHQNRVGDTRTIFIISKRSDAAKQRFLAEFVVMLANSYHEATTQRKRGLLSRIFRALV